jgi:PRTRC genetic system protein A
MPVVGYLVARSAPPVRSGLAYDYVLAGNGLFLVADNDYLRVTIPIASCAVRGLPALYSECSLLHDRLPAVLWDTILQTARKLDSMGQEVLLTARFDLEHGYWLVLPSQVVEPASVRYAPADGVVLEIHSHRTGPARFSATDTADEQRLRLYGVVGRLDRPRPDVALRAGAYGYFLPVAWSTVFDADPTSVHDTQFDPPDDADWVHTHDQTALDNWVGCDLSH